LKFICTGDYVKTFIIVTTDKVGFHKYDNAPDNVKFLRDLHRHKFHIKLGIEVKHDNRELEFFTVLYALESYIRDINEVGSCEMFATNIYNFFKDFYSRNCWVEVWEDKENGARVE